MDSHSSSAYASENEEKISLLVEEEDKKSLGIKSDIDSIDLVKAAEGYVSENDDEEEKDSVTTEARPVSPESAVLLVHKCGDGTPVAVDTSSPVRLTPPMKISPSASLKRKEKMKSMEDEVTVLSQEDVVDSAIGIKAIKPEVKLESEKAERPAYIPPRAFAGLNDEDEDDKLNKGCYYFLACLDSLWIL